MNKEKIMEAVLLIAHSVISLCAGYLHLSIAGHSLLDSRIRQAGGLISELHQAFEADYTIATVTILICLMAITVTVAATKYGPKWIRRFHYGVMILTILMYLAANVT